MGVSYSAPTLKSHLKMAVQRLMMHRNKKTNQISVDSKAVAILLQQGKDESARIRCEAILHEKNLCIAYEMLQLMCELLGARVALVTASKSCPSDLEEAISSVIYCSGRIEIPELKFIVQQYAAKYSSEWCTTHVDNASGKVHPRIVEKLAIVAPPFEVLLGMLQDIAATYNIDWKPDMHALEAGITDHSNPEKLGSIAKIGAAGAATPAAAPTVAAPAAAAAAAPAAKPQSDNVAPPGGAVGASGGYPVAAASGSGKPIAMNPDGTPSPYPGTLNLILHRGRNFVNLASQSDPHDLYVVITNLMSKVRWKSEADPTGGSEPIWFENPRLPNATHHFPLSIADAFQQVQIEVFQANTGLKLHADRLIGSTVMYADTLRKNPGLQWYAVYNSNMEAGYLLLGTQFLPLNAVVLSQEELNNQRAWIEQEQAHAVAQQAQSPSSMAPVMQFLPPGAAQQGGVMMLPMQPPQQQQQQQQFGGPGGPDFAHPQQQQYAVQSPVEMSYPSQPQRYQPGGAGAGSINRSADNSLSDRLKGGQIGALWSQPPESPPHKLGASLSDIAKPRPAPQQQGQLIPASYDDQHVASPHDVALPDAGYQAMGGDDADAEPGSGTHKELVERERAAQQLAAQQAEQQAAARQQLLWEAQRDERKAAHVQSVEDRSASVDPFEYSEFPPVPQHKAGRGSASKAKAAAAGSALAEPLVPQPAAAAASSVEADDPDADLEARFRRLQ